MDALGHRNDAAAETRISRFHVRQKLLKDKDPLRQIDQMRPVISKLLAERRRTCQESGVTAHDDSDIDAWQGCVIQVGAGKRLRHETGSRGEARRVIVADQVIVDRFWNMNTSERIACL